MNDDPTGDEAMSDHIMHDQARRSAGCDAFDATLADYLDETLDPASRAAADAHLASCERCAGLLADLETIAAEARVLPTVAPSAGSVDAMWSGIASRIEAPVVGLEEARAARPAPRRAFGWRRLGAAAAALVLATAGLTYEVTTIAMRRDASRLATRPPATASPAPASVASTGTPESGSPEGTTPGIDVGSSRPAVASSTRGSAGTLVASSSRPAASPLSPAEATYEREIVSLRRILRERRGELDPSTAVVLEENLKVIDRAIAQSRAALARDPRSRFLNQQLNSALDKKVELLRTAAMLPART